MRAIDYFDKSVELHRDRTAIIDGESRYSYQQTRAFSENIARGMLARALEREQRAAIYSQNHAAVLFCMLGMLRAGGAWVPINIRNATDANVEFLNYSETTWLFYSRRFQNQAEELRRRVPCLRNLVCIDGPADDASSLSGLIQQGDAGADLDWSDAYGNPFQMMGLVPTGGTTGPARGVRVTNLAWGTMTEMAMRYWKSEDATPVCLCTAPLSHAAGVVAFTMFALGGTNVVLPGFDASQVLQAIERYQATHLFLPPTAFYALLASPDIGKFDYSSLRVFLLAGSPVSPDKLKKGVEVFGPCMCQSYGQTEAPMLLTSLDSRTVAAAAAGDHPERLRSCGRPTAAVRLAIMDDAGRILPPNEVGEIVARGSLVTGGYHNLPEATAEIRKYGWHHTGDVGYIDEDGYVYIVDRKKDMIISGGFNVYCAEVESGIMALPQVQECAVIGVPDDKWGEAVKAIVVCRPSESLTEAEVIAHCKAKLGGVKSPKTVEFWPELPKTPVGKLDRKTIRKPYWTTVDREVH
ncbi:MAG TPA: AMP-binding protein [Terriglobales bacterium]|nr:AMP-binding protein [Terriglobales bacterium]